MVKRLVKKARGWWCTICSQEILAQLCSLIKWGAETVLKWFMTLGEMVSKAHIDCWNLLSLDLKKKKGGGEGAHKRID